MLRAAFQRISSQELCAYLLRETGQDKRDSVSHKDLLDLLKLQHYSLNLAKDLGVQVKDPGNPPRALLSFNDRLVVTDQELLPKDVRLRFSIFHEIAHYVLPAHVDKLFLCRERDLSTWAHAVIEKEANAFAADLLFQGGRFTLEVNSLPISAKTIKILSEKYRASFESTARRLVEKNLRPCFLVLLERIVPTDRKPPPAWRIRYSLCSHAFGSFYFTSLRDWPVDDPIAERVNQSGRDIADGIITEEVVELPLGKEVRFQVEHFSNRYNVFCLFLPI